MKQITLIALSLLFFAGCSTGTETIIVESEPIIIQQADTLSDWQLLKMAIAYTESRMNPNAVGTNKDSGILQITPIYVKEVNRVSGTTYSHDDAFSIEKSMEMFELMQSAKNPQHDLDRAIYFHNKSPHYKKEVYKNYELMKRFEAVRRSIKKKKL